uniref:Yippee domain-containing protein n=1 Tax=Panagrolaimus sp. ES5 TaxID=591445 RepID=A0AC34GTK0_9BILA
MSDSDEYDKCSDFESDEDQKLHMTVKNGKVEEAVKEDKSESIDSYVYCTEDESSCHSSTPDNASVHSNQSDESMKQQSTNQKMKDLTIHDSVKDTVKELISKVETNTVTDASPCNKTTIKTAKNDYLRFLEEDRKFELDTKFHEHITQLCSEAQRIATTEYEKCADIFGAKNYSTFFTQSKNVSVSINSPASLNAKKMDKPVGEFPQPQEVDDEDKTETAYHKMFLQEQKYINLQIELAESTDSEDARKEIEEKCKEAEKEWISLKNEYESIKASNATSEQMDDDSYRATNNVTVFKATDPMKKNDAELGKNFNPVSAIEASNSSSSTSANPKKVYFKLKIQKAKATMQNYAQNYSSLKLQMYQQNDKKQKSKFSKFVYQAEARWKTSRREYEKLCKEANKFDSIDPTVIEYKNLKSRLHEVKKQIKDSRKKADSEASKDIVTGNNDDGTKSKIRQNNKNEEEILSAAYLTMKNYENYYKGLKKQMQQVYENSTDEFLLYFVNLCKEASRKWNESKDKFEYLNCKFHKPATTTTIYASRKATKKYLCKNCQMYLTNNAELICPNFRGKTGEAFLFSKVENIKTGEIDMVDMMTGRYFIKNVFCKECNQKLGWFYETVIKEDQKYKEGKTVLEKALIQEIAVSDVTNVDNGISQSPKNNHLPLEIPAKTNPTNLNTNNDTNMEAQSNPGNSTRVYCGSPFEETVITMKKLQQSSFDNNTSKDPLSKLKEDFANAQNEIKHYQKFAADQVEALKNLELALQGNSERTDTSILRGKREAFDSNEIVTKRFKDDEE